MDAQGPLPAPTPVPSLVVSQALLQPPGRGFLSWPQLVPCPRSVTPDLPTCSP